MAGLEALIPNRGWLLELRTRAGFLGTRASGLGLGVLGRSVGCAAVRHSCTVPQGPLGPSLKHDLHLRHNAGCGLDILRPSRPAGCDPGRRPDRCRIGPPPGLVGVRAALLLWAGLRALARQILESVGYLPVATYGNEVHAVEGTGIVHLADQLAGMLHPSRRIVAQFGE